MNQTLIAGQCKNKRTRTPGIGATVWRSLFFFSMASALAPGALATEKNDPDMAKLVSGNTLFVANKYGPTRLYFDPAGTLKDIGGHGVPAEGTWRATSDSVCSRVNPEADGEIKPEFCLKLSGRKLGDRWTGDDPRNGKIFFHLVAGKASPSAAQPAASLPRAVE